MPDPLKQPAPMHIGVPEFSELVLACRYRWRSALLLAGTLSLGFALTAAWLAPAKFEAKSLVRVRQHQNSVLAPQASRNDDSLFVRSQEQVVVSPNVVAQALQHDRIKNEPDIPETNAEAIAWLTGLTSVDLKTGSEVMTIAVKHPSAKLAYALSHSITEAYLDEVNNRVIADRERRQKELENAAQEAEKRLSAVWDELHSVAAQIGSDNSQSITLRDEIQLQAYREYSQQLRIAQLKGYELQRRLAEESANPIRLEKSSEPPTSKLAEQHPDAIAFKQRIAELELQIERTREVAADQNSPRIVRLEEEKQSVQKSLESFLVELALQPIDPPDNPATQSGSNLASQLTRELELNEAECEFLKTRMADIDAAVVRTDKHKGVQLDISRHEIERQSRLADSLWQALEELKIESQSQQRVSLLELAEFPLYPNRSSQIKAISAAISLAWLLSILGIGFLEWSSCKIRHGRDLIPNVNLLTFGVAALNSRRQNQDSSSLAAREVVAKLMLLNSNSRSLPSILVTSGNENEPRHFASLDIARALCEFKRQTLMIDCDSYSNKLNDLLGCDDSSGIGQLTLSQCRLREAVFSTSDSRLNYVPLGIKGRESNWIDPQNLRYLIETLGRDYDAIVVNGPSLYDSADGLLIAAQLDHTLLAAFAGTSRWDRLATLEHLATSSGISVLGTALFPQSYEVAAWFQLTHAQTATPRGSKRGSQPALPVELQHEALIEQTLHEEVLALQQSASRSHKILRSHNQPTICGRFTP